MEEIRLLSFRTKPTSILKLADRSGQYKSYILHAHSRHPPRAPSHCGCLAFNAALLSAAWAVTARYRGVLESYCTVTLKNTKARSVQLVGGRAVSKPKQAGYVDSWSILLTSVVDSVRHGGLSPGTADLLVAGFQSQQAPSERPYPRFSGHSHQISSRGSQATFLQTPDSPCWRTALRSATAASLLVATADVAIAKGATDRSAAPPDCAGGAHFQWT